MDADPQAIHRIESKLDEILKCLKMSTSYTPEKISDKNRQCPVCNEVITFAPSAHFDDKKGIMVPDGVRRHCLCKITTQRY